jgi:hypothetical protein
MHRTLLKAGILKITFSIVTQQLKLEIYVHPGISSSEWW